MSATIDSPISIVQARQLLRDTSSLSSERIDAAHGAVAAFYATKPQNHHRCVACSCMRWEEHRAPDGNPVWACGACHRPATLTSEEWHVEWTRQREAADAHLAAAAAAEPKPREKLRQALSKLAEARSTLAQLERALPVARSAVSEEQERHDRATEAAEAVNATAAENLAVAFFDGAKPTDSARAAAAARGELAAAVDALIVAKNARTILDAKLKDAHASVGYASDRARKAARGVIAGGMLEDLLADVTEARATYIERTGQLAWLVQQHAIPDGDARARQLVADANCPPSAWREAGTVGTEAMETALAALMLDAEAII